MENPEVLPPDFQARAVFVRAPPTPSLLAEMASSWRWVEDKEERGAFRLPSRVLLVLQHRFIYPIVGLAPPGGEMVYLTSAKPISRHHGTAICVTHSVFLPLPLIAERGLSVVYLIRDSRSVGVLSQRRPPLA